MFELIFVFWIWGGSISIHQMDEPFATKRSCNDAGALVMKTRETYQIDEGLRPASHRGYYVCVPADSPKLLRGLGAYTIEEIAREHRHDNND